MAGLYAKASSRKSALSQPCGVCLARMRESGTGGERDSKTALQEIWIHHTRKVGRGVPTAPPYLAAPETARWGHGDTAPYLAWVHGFNVWPDNTYSYIPAPCARY